MRNFAAIFSFTLILSACCTKKDCAPDWIDILKIRVEGGFQYHRNFYLIRVNKENNQIIDSTRLVGTYGETDVSSYVFPKNLRNYNYLISRENPKKVDTLRDIKFDSEDKTIFCNTCFGINSDKRTYSEYSNITYTLNADYYTSKFIDIKK